MARQADFLRRRKTSSHLLGELGSETRNPDLGTVFLLNYSNSITPHLVMTAGASWLGELNDQISLEKNSNFAAAPGAPQLPANQLQRPAESHRLRIALDSIHQPEAGLGHRE